LSPRNKRKNLLKGPQNCRHEAMRRKEEGKGINKRRERLEKNRNGLEHRAEKKKVQKRSYLITAVREGFSKPAENKKPLAETRKFYWGKTPYLRRVELEGGGIEMCKLKQNNGEKTL